MYIDAITKCKNIPKKYTIEKFLFFSTLSTGRFYSLSNKIMWASNNVPLNGSEWLSEDPSSQPSWGNINNTDKTKKAIVISLSSSPAPRYFPHNNIPVDAAHHSAQNGYENAVFREQEWLRQHLKGFYAHVTSHAERQRKQTETANTTNKVIWKQAWGKTLRIAKIQKTKKKK